jgi:poly-D-alanine transfer protein DltD
MTKTIASIGMYDTQEEFDEDMNYLESTLDKLFPDTVLLTASNSNWRGQTGTAEATGAEQIVSKVHSFGPDNGFDFKHDDEDGYYFRLATHDVPMGFNIYIEELPNED